MAKLRDVVGLYLHPPAHVIVLSVDEKSRTQTLKRTQPGLPIQEGRPDTATHNYLRHGTTTLFAALRARRHGAGPLHAAPPHQGFVRFLNAMEAAVPAGKLVHAPPNCRNSIATYYACNRTVANVCS